MARRMAVGLRCEAAPIGALALMGCGRAWARAWGFRVPPTEDVLRRGAQEYGGLEAYLQAMGERLIAQALWELRWHEPKAAQRFANAALAVARLAFGRGCGEHEARALLLQAQVYAARGMHGMARSCRRRALPSGALPEGV